MDLWGSRSKVAGGLSGDLSMDPTLQDAKDPHDPSQNAPHGQDPVHTDGQDPASPGGAAPYNGVEPFGEPAVDDPLWKDPADEEPDGRAPIPHVEGPDEDKTTLHNARHASYLAKAARYGTR